MTTCASLAYYASLTDGPSVFRNTLKLLEGAAPAAVRAFSSVLSTPIFLNADALRILRTIKEEGGRIGFDSGGYYVQVGRIGYYDLYQQVLATYRSHPWADWYVLPDFVPNTGDDDETLSHKVRETVSFSTLFFSELPDALKERAVPVVHGRTLAQIEYCLERYLKLGVRAIGFGSFTTCGRGQEANVATLGALANVRAIVAIARQAGLRVHLLGLGAPSLVAMISGIGASSFDSASWIKSAGFGQVHLPFTRGYNITHRNGDSVIQKGITWERFTELKNLTGHACTYCESYATLTARKMHRAVHNLLCVTEAVRMVNNGEFERIARIYEHGSPKYREAAATWLPRH